MTLNYAEQWQPNLLEVIIGDTYISPFIRSNVKWLNAKTFHFTQMSTSGYKNHTRDAGWNAGTYQQQDVPFTVMHDRDIEFMIDKADVDETNATASIQNISSIFIKTNAVPEMDAQFFSTIATKALSISGQHSSTKEVGITPETVLPYLKNIFKNKGLKQYKARGALIAYVSTHVMTCLELSKDFVRKIEITSISGLGASINTRITKYKARGALIAYVSTHVMTCLELSKDFVRKIEITSISGLGASINTRITNLDGVTLIEVIDDERFKTKFTYDNGFAAHSSSKDINVLVATPLTSMFVPKIASIYAFQPGQHTKGDGWLYQNRAFWDTFIMPNGLDNKIDSIYVDTLDASE